MPGIHLFWTVQILPSSSTKEHHPSSSDLWFKSKKIWTPKSPVNSRQCLCFLTVIAVYKISVERGVGKTLLKMGLCLLYRGCALEEVGQMKLLHKTAYSKNTHTHNNRTISAVLNRQKKDHSLFFFSISVTCCCCFLSLEFSFIKLATSSSSSLVYAYTHQQKRHLN